MAVANVLFIYCFLYYLYYQIQASNIEERNLTILEIMSNNEDEESEPKLYILCNKGLSPSLSYFWLCRSVYFVQQPLEYQLYFGTNSTQIRNNYKSSWFSFVTYWKSTSHTIPAFNYYCVGISTSDKFKVMFIQHKISLWCLSLFMTGFLMFKFAYKISRHILFYYATCTTIGVLASLLIIMFFIAKFVPKKVGALIILFSSSASIVAAQLLWNNIYYIITTYTQYILIYVFFAILISLSFSYIYGPITNHKLLNLMQWGLQFLGLFFIFLSSEIYEYNLILISMILVFHNINFKKFVQLRYFSRSYRSNKSNKKLITINEYQRQGDIETRKALEELRKYCLSPECNAWKVMCQLKEPIRFAKFIEGEPHITDEEISLYESTILSGNNLLQNGENSNSLSNTKL